MPPVPSVIVILIVQRKVKESKKYTDLVKVTHTAGTSRGKCKCSQSLPKGTGRMALWVKVLLCNHEDLTLNPQHPRQRAGNGNKHISNIAGGGTNPVHTDTDTYTHMCAQTQAQNIHRETCRYTLTNRHTYR